MVTLIQSGPGWDAPRLAREFGVNIRTIYRDIGGLEEVGLPCQYSRARKGYEAKEGVFLPPVQLSVQEALSLAVLCEQAAGAGGIPFLGAACRGIEKLRCMLPASTREEVRLMLDGVRVRTAASADPAEAKDVYERLSQAVRSRTIMRCRYDSPSASRDFEFHPYALFFCVRAWYAVGHHAGHGALRTLKLNRFAAVTETGRTFTRPDSFNVDRYLGNAWRMVRGDDVEVEVWFDAEFAPTIADTIWHPTQRLDEHPDGSMTFRCTVAGLDEIVWWVLSMGPHCIVRRPAELIDRVTTLATQITRAYRPAPAATKRQPRRARTAGPRAS